MISSFQSEHLPPFKNDQCGTFISEFTQDYVILSAEIERRLSRINVHKSLGPDGLPNWFLRDFASLISDPLAGISNASLREGYLPPIWKAAEVVLVPKVSPPTSIQNDLRPISLLPTLVKVFESFVGRWLLSFLKSKLDHNQFGNRKGRSTTHMIISVLHTWMSCLDSGGYARTVFVDFRKALDLVNHNILYDKLKKYGIPDFLLQWFGFYLSNRQQSLC